MKKNLAIIGGGTAGIFLASFIDTDVYNVTIFEKQKTLGRKFLVAGKGGFNLTHSEDISSFKEKYSPALYLDKTLKSFTNEDFRKWLLSIGIPSYVGSSKRVFPEKEIKPIQVLKRIENHLIEKKINFEFNKTFTEWDNDQNLIFNSGERFKAEYVVFALGGASWKITGSDGSWLDLFNKKHVATKPFRSSNCAFKIDWSESFIKNHEGTALKNLSVSIKNKIQKGEAVITKYGIEGNAIYGLSPEIQSSLYSTKEAVVYIDFKPNMDEQKIKSKINDSNLNKTTALKKVLKLPPAAVSLIKNSLDKEAFLNINDLIKHIKHFPLKLEEAAPIDEAISTSGGIQLNAVDAKFQLKNINNHYCIGEMLDWDAPTGGYLIQACASMAYYLAQYLNNKHLKKF